MSLCNDWNSETSIQRPHGHQSSFRFALGTFTCWTAVFNTPPPGIGYTLKPIYPPLLLLYLLTCVLSLKHFKFGSQYNSGSVASVVYLACAALVTSLYLYHGQIRSIIHTKQARCVTFDPSSTLPSLQAPDTVHLSNVIKSGIKTRYAHSKGL